VSVRPAVPAALLGLALAIGTVGCAGTDAPVPQTAGSSSAPSSTTGSATATAAPTGGVTRIEVDLAGGQVTGNAGRIPIGAGESVTLAITSDVADEVHVHGYDLTAELVPGETAELTFDAAIPGVFEVELHEAGTVLLTLQVQ
jgi:hypothetical protein